MHAHKNIAETCSGFDVRRNIIANSPGNKKIDLY